MKQLAKFPFINSDQKSIVNDNNDTATQVQKPINFDYFEFGEVIKILVLVTKKREKVLGRDYDFIKLIFVTLASVGIHDGISACYRINTPMSDIEASTEINEKQAKEFEAKQHNSFGQPISEYNEKTGEAVLKYPIYETKLVWSQLPIITSFNFLEDISDYCVPCTYLLNFLTLLLVVQGSVAEALYLPSLLSRDCTKSSKQMEAKVREVNDEVASKFSEINYRIERNLLNNLKEKYNVFKLNAFTLVKSVNYQITDPKQLLIKDKVFEFNEFNNFFNNTAPYVLLNLQNLFLSFTYIPIQKLRHLRSKGVAELQGTSENAFLKTKLMTLPNMSQLSTFLSLSNSESNQNNATTTTAAEGSAISRFAQENVNITPLCTFNPNNFRSLFIGSKNGFSLKSFEHRVFNWNAPSLLLISGKKVVDPLTYGLKKNSKFMKFNQHYPNLIHSSVAPLTLTHRLNTDPSNSAASTSKKLQAEKLLGETVVYGVYVNQPWRKTNKHYFGDGKTMIFQLSSKQNIFKAKRQFTNTTTTNETTISATTGSMNTNYAYFNTEGGGIGFGSSQPIIKNNSLLKYQPGNVSLTIDANLEFAVFRHTGIGAVFEEGTAFQINRSDASSGNEAKAIEASPIYDEKFLINEIEVWGIGSDEVFQQQIAHWQWEEKEAEKRNRVNLKSLGEERAFLEMAGLVGQNNASGGSI